MGTYVSGRTRSVYFQCNEVLVSELFDTLPNDAQRLALTELQNAGHHDVRWATSDEIRSRGVVPRVRLEADIAANAAWIL
ncbi:MAG: hypothetical protein JNK04_19615 [Myxococcales bacterium]|nr:hypothetical protein [Myxococcales bacterium]